MKANIFAQKQEELNQSKTEEQKLAEQNDAPKSIFAKPAQQPEEKKPLPPFGKPAEPKEDSKQQKPGLFSTPGSLFGTSTTSALFSKSSTLFEKPAQSTLFGQSANKTNAFGGAVNLLQQNKNAFVESKSGEDENDDDEEIEKEPQTFLEVNK